MHPAHQVIRPQQLRRLAIDRHLPARMMLVIEQQHCGRVGIGLQLHPLGVILQITRRHHGGVKIQLLRRRDIFRN